MADTTTLNYRLTIENDTDMFNPLEEYDGQWTLNHFDRHRTGLKNRDDFKIEPEDDDAPLELDPSLREKLRSGLAFFLKFRYGEFVVKNDPEGDIDDYDGVLVWDHDPNEMGAKTYDERKKDAEAGIGEYNNWANGYVYWYRLEKVDNCAHCGHEITEEIDSCGGFIGAEYAAQHIREEVIKDIPAENLKIVGEAKDIMS